MPSFDWVGQVAPAVAALGTALFGLARGQRRLRTNLRHDAETVKELPDGSAARTQLMSHIEWQITKLRESESDGRRDWSGVTLGVIFAVGFGYLTVWLFSQDGWWRWLGVPAVLLAALGLFGLSEGLMIKKRVPREHRAKPGGH